MSLIWYWWHWGVHVDWGNIPGYFSGGALLYAARTYRNDAKSKASTQAAKVGVWSQWNGQNPPDGQWQVWVSNSSDTPISDVVVTVEMEVPRKVGEPPKKRGEGWLGQPEGKTYVKDVPHRFLGPGNAEVFMESKTSGNSSGIGHPITPVKLSFKDSAGKTWIQHIEKGCYTSPKQIKEKSTRGKR